MKAVIMAAGYGTRFLPASKSLPKEMFPLINKPVIQFLIEELENAGISEVLIVSHRKKKILEDYFDRDPELESFFKNSSKVDYEECIKPTKLKVHFIRQQHMNGSGGALLLCESFVGNDPFILAYPDDIVLSSKSLSLQMIESYNQHPCSILACENLEGDVSRFGVIAKGQLLQENLFYAKDIIEKPKKGEQPSQTISIGRYLLTSEIFPILKECYKHHKKEGEFVLTDALEVLAQKNRLLSFIYEGKRLDVGDPLSYARSFLFLIKNDPLYSFLLSEKDL